MSTLNGHSPFSIKGGLRGFLGLLEHGPFHLDLEVAPGAEDVLGEYAEALQEQQGLLGMIGLEMSAQLNGAGTGLAIVVDTAADFDRSSIVAMFDELDRMYGTDDGPDLDLDDEDEAGDDEDEEIDDADLPRKPY